MTVKDYYYLHFTELSPKKRFHFATRMKNYLKVRDFDKYLKENQPSTNISEVINNNDYSGVNNYKSRKPFFEKYQGIYGMEAALFRVHHLLVEYDIDLRDELVNLCPKSRLYQMSDNLMQDKDAFGTLSTWAINMLYLTEELYPRGKNVIKEMADLALGLECDIDPTLLSYLYTHIIICASGFYIKDLARSKNKESIKKILEKCAELITENIDTISLDACVEFLVCCNLAGIDYPELRVKINEICEEYKKNSPYLINYRRDKTPGSYFHTLDGAEHINALYIMSGLDS
ncbi:MAG: hypothetical protein Q4F61_03575, partial [Candidatus Saccharibacteria bacterium]|nr:hypothetical protein [Candidatus Saccharibacteria bacterium]